MLSPSGNCDMRFNACSTSCLASVAVPAVCFSQPYSSEALPPALADGLHGSPKLTCGLASGCCAWRPATQPRSRHCRCRGGGRGSCGRHCSLALAARSPLCSNAACRRAACLLPLPAAAGGLAAGILSTSASGVLTGASCLEGNAGISATAVLAGASCSAAGMSGISANTVLTAASRSATTDTASSDGAAFAAWPGGWSALLAGAANTRGDDATGRLLRTRLRCDRLYELLPLYPQLSRLCQEESAVTEHLLPTAVATRHSQLCHVTDT